MYQTIFILAQLACLAATQDVVTSLFIPNFGQDAYVGSIIDAHNSTTTYSIGCNFTIESACLAEEGLTLIESPQTMAYDLIFNSGSGNFFLNVTCNMTPTASQAYCTEYESGDIAWTTGETSYHYVNEDYVSAFVNVTLIGGVHATTSGTASDTTSASAAASATAVTATTTNTTTTAAAVTSSLNSTSTIGHLATSKVPPATQNVGMVQVTGNVQWAAGGAALAMVLASM